MIRFPKISIASSVVNRILNVHADIEANSATMAPPSAAATPNVPDTKDTGAALNQSLYAPLAPVDAEQPLADAVALKGIM